MYHCSLASGRKVLQATLMTDCNLSTHCKAGFEEASQHQAYVPIADKSFEYVLCVRVKYSFIEEETGKIYKLKNLIF
jgi:hypothetical protein